MSISITINNINDLTDTERAVLRLLTGETAAFAPSVADMLKTTVRSIAEDHNDGRTMRESLDAGLPHYGAHGVFERVVPIEPTEALSPHTQVVELPQAPTPPAASGSAELDANSLPWDKRIHSSSRAKVADGRWKYARNLDKALIATVEAELRAVQAIPGPASSATSTNPPGWPFTEATVSNTFGTGDTPPVLVNHDPSQTLPPDYANVEAVNGVLTVTTIVPLPPVAPPAPSALPMTFAQLMQHVTPLLVSGKLTQPILQSVCQSVGLPHLASLGARPDLVETVKAAIDAAVGGAQ